ncbi:MAG: aryl-sulfate sulfotransferase [Chthonomonadales bacterium]
MRTLSVLAIGLISLSALRIANAQEVQHRLIGQDRGHAAILDKDGKVEWMVDVPFTSHDISALPNGNFLLHMGPNTVTEMTPAKEVVWTYTAKPVAPYTGAVEVHGFQRLKDGLTLVAETGNKRLVEVDKAGNVVHSIPLTVDNPNSHRDTRLVRKLDNGNYLVCHEADATVREYDSTGKVVWHYTLDLNNQPRTPNHDGHGVEVFGAVRLKNGNTLIAGGNNNRVLEVTKDGKIVWTIERDELPGIHLCWVTTLQVLPNGHIVFGNTHAGPNNPQLVEVTKDKKVVWTLKNFDTFGNDLCATQLLDVKGKVIR